LLEFAFLLFIIAFSISFLSVISVNVPSVKGMLTMVVKFLFSLCEHTSILRALIEYPQGNLEEIQEKILKSTQEEPGGHQDRKAQTYATEHYTANRTASANTGEAIRTLVPITSPPRPPS
jgi:hypothetical protein